ncbi:MAG: exodeoxyribonuclease VII large subunit [bacterium]
MENTLTNKASIYSVSRLNTEIRSAIENSFPLLWIEGEISNLATPRSGHLYFSLKDEHAQIRCAMFRNKRLLLREQPQNGMKVLVRARVGVYEARGEVQLVIENLEPSGEGALQRAFEALKQKLADEGLFDQQHKQPLPRFPKTIGIITSPQGAAVRDVLHVLNRRAPATQAIIYPTSVQGNAAPTEIVEALDTAIQRGEVDLLILTRGGGSLEDLMAFNDEMVARKIATCPIPLVAAVGHEVDFTIADFVADKRAPTPSAAAEIAVPDQQELARQLSTQHKRLTNSIARTIREIAQYLAQFENRLQQCHPRVRIQQQQLRNDELSSRLERRMTALLEQHLHRLMLLRTRLKDRSPAILFSHQLARVTHLQDRLIAGGIGNLNHRKALLKQCSGKLNALSPLAVMSRGYSITRDPESGKVYLDASEVISGQTLETRLERGSVVSIVEKILPVKQK